MAMFFAKHMAQALPKINRKGVIQYNDCHNYDLDFEIAHHLLDSQSTLFFIY